MGDIVSFRARDGRRMFSFSADTDPEAVVLEYAWAWAEPDRQSVCGRKPCPTDNGTYCCECHGVASSAVSTYRRRFDLDHQEET